MNDDTLKPQTTLRDYVVKRVLGRGSFGVTYLAEEIVEHRAVAIKEYLPFDIAMRDADGSTVNVSRSSPGGSEEFQTGLDKFLEESRTLSGLKSPYIVQVTDTFELNGTAYMVMKYEEGGTLDRYLSAHQEPLKEAQILSVFTPLLEGLRTIHAKWLLHRDIKPDNIYIRRDGSPLLIDFGTARHALSAKHGGMTEYLTPGFAPPEQYDRNADHGPWTDIYAVGATMYYCVTRIKPYEGRFRSRERDPVVPATRAAPAMYNGELLEIIDWMMKPDHRDRPQSVEEVLLRLQELQAPEGRDRDPEDAAVQGAKTRKRAKRGGTGARRAPLGVKDTAGDTVDSTRTETRWKARPSHGDRTGSPEPEPMRRVEETTVISSGGGSNKRTRIAIGAAATVLLGAAGLSIILDRTPAVDEPGAVSAVEAPPQARSIRSTDVPPDAAERPGGDEETTVPAVGKPNEASVAEASSDAQRQHVEPASRESAEPAPAASSKEPAAAENPEIALWDAIKDSDDPREIRAYIDKYPEGTFFGLARARLAGLEAGSGEGALEVAIEGPEVVPLNKKTYFTINSSNAVKARWSIGGFTNGWVKVDPMVDGHQIYIEPTDSSRAGDWFTLVFVVFDESGQSKKIRKRFQIGR